MRLKSGVFPQLSGGPHPLTSAGGRVPGTWNWKLDRTSESEVEVGALIINGSESDYT